jgi:hypothetical protein
MAVIFVTKRYNVIAYLGWHRGKMSGCDTVSYELPASCLVHVGKDFVVVDRKEDECIILGIV